MSAISQPEPQDEFARLDKAVDQAIEVCGGDLRHAIRSLILANEFLEHELNAQVSAGYVRGVKHGRFKCYNG